MSLRRTIATWRTSPTRWRSLMVNILCSFTIYQTIYYPVEYMSVNNNKTNNSGNGIYQESKGYSKSQLQQSLVSIISCLKSLGCYYNIIKITFIIIIIHIMKTQTQGLAEIYRFHFHIQTYKKKNIFLLQTFVMSSCPSLARS